MKISSVRVRAFRTTVWKYYRAHGRDTLPWRTTHDPYRIFVSEIMLQQTQVERVIPYYKNWLELFPNVHALANAPLSDVLRAWQGLGYNRRAKMLHETAKTISKNHNGVFPKTREALEALPGVGAYTAGAVLAFASNKDVVLLETNIRTAVTHHFFPDKKKVDDVQVRAVLTKAFPKGKAREWYGALMDYGAHLKKSGVRLNPRAKGYAKQKKFIGSNREARGAILKLLTKSAKNQSALELVLGEGRKTQVKKQITALTKEGLIRFSRGAFRLPR